LAQAPALANAARHYLAWPEPLQILVQLAAQFGLLILVSLATPPIPADRLDPFFARLLTPVGKEGDMSLVSPPAHFADEAALGLQGPGLDYAKTAHLGYAGLRRLGLEIPRMGWMEWGGFIVAWVTVGALLALLYGLSRAVS